MSRRYVCNAHVVEPRTIRWTAGDASSCAGSNKAPAHYQYRQEPFTSQGRTAERLKGRHTLTYHEHKNNNNELDQRKSVDTCRRSAEDNTRKMLRLFPNVLKTPMVAFLKQRRYHHFRTATRVEMDFLCSPQRDVRHWIMAFTLARRLSRRSRFSRTSNTTLLPSPLTTRLALPPQVHSL